MNTNNSSFGPYSLFQPTSGLDETPINLPRSLSPCINQGTTSDGLSNENTLLELHEHNGSKTHRDNQRTRLYSDNVAFQYDGQCNSQSSETDELLEKLELDGSSMRKLQLIEKAYKKAQQMSSTYGGGECLTQNFFEGGARDFSRRRFDYSFLPSDPFNMNSSPDVDDTSYSASDSNRRYLNDEITSERSRQYSYNGLYCARPSFNNAQYSCHGNAWFKTPSRESHSEVARERVNVYGDHHPQNILLRDENIRHLFAQSKGGETSTDSINQSHYVQGARDNQYSQDSGYFNTIERGSVGTLASGEGHASLHPQFPRHQTFGSHYSSNTTSNTWSSPYPSYVSGFQSSPWSTGFRLFPATFTEWSYGRSQNSSTVITEEILADDSEEDEVTKYVQPDARTEREADSKLNESSCHASDNDEADSSTDSQSESTAGDNRHNVDTIEPASLDCEREIYVEERADLCEINTDSVSERDDVANEAEIILEDLIMTCLSNLPDAQRQEFVADEPNTEAERTAAFEQETQSHCQPANASSGSKRKIGRMFFKRAKSLFCRPIRSIKRSFLCCFG